MKLYHYVHCPFCIRVRMALGLLNIEFDSVVLPYDDEATPLSLTGVKMLPIFSFNNEDTINESLNIIKKLDPKNVLQTEKLDSLDREDVEELLSKLGSNVHSLCMPYWIWTPEFDSKSRKYFQDKKEVKRGPFNLLIQNKEKYIDQLDKDLSSLTSSLKPFYNSSTISILDIMIASHIWGMYIFPEYRFPLEVHEFLQRVKSLCNFDYHVDFWK